MARGGSIFFERYRQVSRPRFLATGLFDGFARNVFVNEGGAVKLVGDEPFDGKPAIHFTYVLSSLGRKWNINWLGARGDVGTSGEFWVDKNSFKLLRLDAVATDMPGNLPLKRMKVVIDYNMLSIASKDALIPSGAEILAIETNGTEDRDVIAFSQCHAFMAESKLSNSPDLVDAMKAYEIHRDHLPAGLDLPIILDTQIHTDTVRLGDLVVAHLNKPIKISPELRIPRGATVKGRIRLFSQLDDPRNTCEIGFSFDEIDWPGHFGVFFAEPVQIEEIAGLSQFISESAMHTDMFDLGLRTNSMTENIWPHRIPGVATFFLSGSHMIPKGFRMTWRTRKTRQR